MHILSVTDWDSDTQFAELEFRYNRRFIEILKRGIPAARRYYNSSTESWWVHADKLPLVVRFGRRFFGHVNYGGLPESVQIRIVRLNELWDEDSSKDPHKTYEHQQWQQPSKTKDDYAVLFLTEKAPWEVIVSAYRSLALMHHPDRGGNEETLKEINRAFDSLKNHLKKS